MGENISSLCVFFEHRPMVIAFFQIYIVLKSSSPIKTILENKSSRHIANIYIALKIMVSEPSVPKFLFCSITVKFIWKTIFDYHESLDVIRSFVRVKILN